MGSQLWHMSPVCAFVIVLMFGVDGWPHKILCQRHRPLHCCVHCWISIDGPDKFFAVFNAVKPNLTDFDELVSLTGTLHHQMYAHQWNLINMHISVSNFHLYTVHLVSCTCCRTFPSLFWKRNIDLLVSWNVHRQITKTDRIGVTWGIVTIYLLPV